MFINMKSRLESENKISYEDILLKLGIKFKKVKRLTGINYEITTFDPKLFFEKIKCLLVEFKFYIFELKVYDKLESNIYDVYSYKCLNYQKPKEEIDRNNFKYIKLGDRGLLYEKYISTSLNMNDLPISNVEELIKRKSEDIVVMGIIVKTKYKELGVDIDEIKYTFVKRIINNRSFLVESFNPLGENKFLFNFCKNELHNEDNYVKHIVERLESFGLPVYKVEVLSETNL